MTVPGYSTDSDLRRALEDRLRTRARAARVPIDRLRAQVAFARLLARFADTDPHSWALKGGVSLLWRLGDAARATRDVDTTWRAAAADLEDFLSQAVERNLADGFQFTIGDAKPMQGEADEGALRYHVRSVMAGRTFHEFHLDVNVVPDDPRPVDHMRMPFNDLAFAGLPDITIPLITVAQQLSEKLHACARQYADDASSRPKDAYDTVALAFLVPIPASTMLLDAVTVTFGLRGTPVPRTPPELPAVWDAPLAQLLIEYPLKPPVADPPGLVGRFAMFWAPVLTGTSGQWHPTFWRWTAT